MQLINLGKGSLTCSFCIDMAIANAIGVFADDVSGEEFDAINHLDDQEWLWKHSATQIILEATAVCEVYNLGLVLSSHSGLLGYSE